MQLCRGLSRLWRSTQLFLQCLIGSSRNGESAVARADSYGGGPSCLRETDSCLPSSAEGPAVTGGSYPLRVHSHRLPGARGVPTPINHSLSQ